MPIFLALKITPNAAKNQIMGWEDAVLRLRIKGIPEKGRVNEQLIAFLAESLQIAKSQIEIVSGHTTRHKRVKIAKITPKQFEECLESFGVIKKTDSN